MPCLFGMYQQTGESTWISLHSGHCPLVCGLKPSLCSSHARLLKCMAPLSRLWHLLASCLMKFCWAPIGSFSTLPIRFHDMLTSLSTSNTTVSNRHWYPDSAIRLHCCYCDLLVMTASPRMLCGSPYPHPTKATYFLIHDLALQLWSKGLAKLSIIYLFGVCVGGISPDSPEFT